MRLEPLDVPLSFDPAVRESRLLTHAPWVRSVGVGDWAITTEGWKFPAPAAEIERPAKLTKPEQIEPPSPQLPDLNPAAKPAIRPRPTADTVLFKDRLLYLLQPPLDNIFNGRQLELPFTPFPYSTFKGIAFLMPRHAALLADEMGLGKTAQAILALRLLFHQGMIRTGLIVAPKPLIHNWSRELKQWAPDLPFEAFDGDAEDRRRTWLVSNSPLKLINYEALTRDVDLATDPRVKFDVMVLDEAQRIKNRESKTAQVVRGVTRTRSWALTGTPIENHPDDLVNIFAFVDPGRVPQDTPPKRIATLTSDSILRRTKDDVMTDMPPKASVRDAVGRSHGLPNGLAVIAGPITMRMRSCSSQRAWRHHNRSARVSTRDAPETNLQFRSAHGRKCQAGTVVARHGRSGGERSQGDYF